MSNNIKLLFPGSSRSQYSPVILSAKRNVQLYGEFVIKALRYLQELRESVYLVHSMVWIKRYVVIILCTFRSKWKPKETTLAKLSPDLLVSEEQTITRVLYYNHRTGQIKLHKTATLKVRFAKNNTLHFCCKQHHIFCNHFAKTTDRQFCLG